MRVIFWYMDSFSYDPAIKNLEQAETVSKGASFEKAIVAFVHGEEKDVDERGRPGNCLSMGLPGR